MSGPATMPAGHAPGPSIAEFEALDFDLARFDHEAHVCVAWRYLQHCDVLTAIERYAATLRRLTAKLGVPGKYHETITWFYLLAVAERAVGEAASDWGRFQLAAPELFAAHPGFVERYYSAELLRSEQARARFVLPDRVPGIPTFRRHAV